MGHNSTQMPDPGTLSFRLNFSTKCGCFISAKPWPIRFDPSSVASYRFEFLGSLEPPVSRSVSPAWNKKGISRGFPFTKVFAQVALNAKSSSL